MSDKPRYSFGDVKGIMRESMGFSVGGDEKERIDIEFTYRDTRDGKLYRAVASGWRELVKEEPKP